MKAYSQFLKELPSKKVVFAFGAFQPPTISHELLVKTVDNLATEQKAEKAIYATINEDLKKNPIPPHRKAYYLKRMFPEANIRTAESLIEAAKKLNERYKNAVMVAPSDRVAEYQKLLEKHNGKDYNFDSIMVVSSGQLDPDADTSKLREAVKKNDLELFKESMPQHFTTMDTKRLMNEMRQGMGLELIKEQVKLPTDWLRESYFRGELFQLGDIVETDNTVYRIQKLGSNHLLLQNEQGNLVSKWVRDVIVSQKPFNFQGKITEMKFTASDKIKVAKIIASSLGVTDVDKTSSPEQLVNNALRKVRNKPMRPEYISILHNMLQTARQAGIEYDEKLVPAKVSEETITELSTDLLGRYKTGAHASAKAADSSGNYAKGDKRFRGINKATFKQFDNDLKKHKQNVPQPGGTNAVMKLDTVKEEKPCWSNYKMVGMKKKGNKQVPNCVPEELQIEEAHVEFRLDHRDKVQGDHKTTFADHGATVSDTTDKATYVKVPAEKADSFKSAMKSKHGVKAELAEEFDLYEDIKKEYDSLKKNHDIKSLRGLIRTQHRIIDTSEFKTKDHAISHYLRSKHGNKKVAAAFGLKEDFDVLEEAAKTIDKGEYDYEGQMARTQLQTTLRNCKDMIQMIKDDDNMPEWVQNKITLAQDYITTVRDYLQSKEELGEAKNFAQQAAIAIAKKKSGKYNKDGIKLGEDAANIAVADSSQNTLTKKFPLQPKGSNSKTAPEGTPTQSEPVKLPLSLHTQKTKYRLGEEIEFDELDEESFYEEIDAISVLEDIIDAYEDKELVIIDEDTDEEYQLSDLEEEVDLEEALSRMERIRRKQRFARTKSKREMRTKIALKKTSSMPVLNTRAKRLAINMIKKRMLRKDPSTASVQEKERVEKFIKSRPQVVQRLAKRLVPRVRQVEKARLRGQKYKGTM